MEKKTSGFSAFGKLGLVVVVVLACYVAWNATQGKQPQASTAPLPLSNEPVIELLTSESKTGWLEVQIEQFNEAHLGQCRIEPKFLGTRAGMLAILNNCEKPVLWAPSSAVWAKNLSEEWPKQHSGEIIDPNESANFKSILSTPLVFLTTKEKARYLQPILGGSASPWEAIREFGTGQLKAPWGPFRFSHANPLVSNCGMLTMTLILTDYARRNAPGKPLAEVAASPAFSTYLVELEKTLVYDEPAQEGSNKQRLAFIRDPNRYDVITNYESNALDAVQIYPNMAIIRPRQSVVSEFAIGMLKGNWVTPAQAQGAREFLKQVTTPEAEHYGTIFHWHAASANDLKSNVGELPSYDAIDKTIAAWRINVAHLPTETQTVCQ